MPESNVAKWKKNRVHPDITLPSGQKVSIQVPNLPEMLRNGEVPNPLVKYAQDAANELSGLSAEEFSMEKLKEATDFLRWLVSATVKEPELTPEDVPELPAEDVDMIVEFAMRGRDTDALGHHLAGLEKLPAWRQFRYERLVP